MTRFAKYTLRSAAKSIRTVLRNLIDGPDPSAPYSWAGTKRFCKSAEGTKCKKTDGYIGIC